VWTPSGFLYPWGAAVPETETPPLPAHGLQRQQRQLHASREVHPVPVRRLSQLDKLQALFFIFFLLKVHKREKFFVSDFEFFTIL
jgi:hypothetical protein